MFHLISISLCTIHNHFAKLNTVKLLFYMIWGLIIWVARSLGFQWTFGKICHHCCVMCRWDVCEDDLDVALGLGVEGGNDPGPRPWGAGPPHLVCPYKWKLLLFFNWGGVDLQHSFLLYSKLIWWYIYIHFIFFFLLCFVTGYWI